MYGTTASFSDQACMFGFSVAARLNLLSPTHHAQEEEEGKEEGKEKVAPEPPPYFKVTLPENYLFGDVIGKSLFAKNDMESEAQRVVDQSNAKSLTLELPKMQLDELPLRLHRLINLKTLNLQGNNLFSTERK